MCRHKVFFLTRNNILAGTNSGGLQVSRRNLEVLNRIFGKENILLGIVTSDQIQSEANVLAVTYHANMLYRYSLFFRMKELVTDKNRNRILEYIETNGVDIVFFDGSLFGSVIERVPERILKIVYFHNIEKEYFYEYLKKKNRLFYIRYLSAWHNEKKSVKHADLCISINRRDGKLLHQYYDRKPDMIFPVTFEDGYSERHEACDEPYLAFIGSYFEPNIQGVQWFAEHVLPYLDCRLFIIGKGMERLRDKNLGDKAVVVGETEDLSYYYATATAVVIPIFMGSGMKVKTAEALMYGKTIFASDEALEGYAVEHINGIFRCNTAQEYIQSIRNYLHSNDKKLVNEDVRDLFINHYCTDSYEKVMRDIIEGKLKDDAK